MIITLNKTSKIGDKIEKYIIKKTKKPAPKCYQRLTDSTIDKIINKVKHRFNKTINRHVIISINSSYMKDYIINNYYKLKQNENKIIKEYPHTNILLLSQKYDLSPVTIFKLVFEQKYNVKLSNIIKNTHILDDYDAKQFNKAVKHDIYFQLDQTQSMEDAINFENNVEQFLINNNIKYKKQKELVEEQKKLYGQAINTPDFLIESELIINNMRIKWIDAKNYYGANINFIKNKIKKQIKKYISSYGTGCIVFSLGHNNNLNILNTICIDYDNLIPFIKK